MKEGGSSESRVGFPLRRVAGGWLLLVGLGVLGVLMWVFCLAGSQGGGGEGSGIVWVIFTFVMMILLPLSALNLGAGIACLRGKGKAARVVPALTAILDAFCCVAFAYYCVAVTFNEAATFKSILGIVLSGVAAFWNAGLAVVLLRPQTPPT